MTPTRLRRLVRSILRESSGRSSPAEETAKRAVSEYMGIPYEAGLVEFMAQEDPSHPGVVAVRVEGATGDIPADFLVSNCDRTPDVDRDVEDVEFKTWPPTRSGRGSRMTVGRF